MEETGKGGGGRKGEGKGEEGGRWPPITQIPGSAPEFDAPVRRGVPVGILPRRLARQN